MKKLSTALLSIIYCLSIIGGAFMFALVAVAQEYAAPEIFSENQNPGSETPNVKSLVSDTEEKRIESEAAFNASHAVFDSFSDAEKEAWVRAITDGGFYEEFYSKATEEQLAEVQALRSPDGIGRPRELRRALLTIAGVLPEDQQRLTLDQVTDICKRVNDMNIDGSYNQFVMLTHLFNQVAGAPDYCGGNLQLVCRYYFADGDGSIIVTSENTEVIYGDSSAETVKTLFPVSVDDPSL